MPNRTYDLVVLLDADAPTDTRTKIVSDAQTLIGQHGEVKANKDWGTRQLPYLIDHHEQAAYHVFQFESDPQAISKLDRGLKLTEGVLRFRIFETEPGKALPESPPLFKREERAYERPPREASATPRLDESSEAPVASKPDTAAETDTADSAVTAEGTGETAAEAAPESDAAPAETAPVETASAEDAPAENGGEPVADAADAATESDSGEGAPDASAE
ncbi:MAG: 30S ribosomal protein S6 [Actinobacteria bacterium]|nr:30S ribosomal protein S6 [Actinomycetota bacterium]